MNCSKLNAVLGLGSYPQPTKIVET